MRVATNGINTQYQIEGNGPWLVMSHSLACDSNMWDPQVAVLKNRYRVLRYDTRGHGQTEAPQGEYTLELLADDLQALLDALDVTKCHFMGCSMGGMIAQTHALKYPGRFSSMLLCNTSSRMGPEAAPVWRERIETVSAKGMEAVVEPTLARWFTEPFRKSNPPAINSIANAIRHTPLTGYVGCCHAIPKLNLTDQLKSIQCPTLVVAGDKDPGTPVEMARAIQLAIPNAQLAVIPHAAHLSNLEQPEITNYLVSKFLGDLDGHWC